MGNLFNYFRSMRFKVPIGKYCFHLERAINCEHRYYIDCQKYKVKLKPDHKDPNYWHNVLKCPQCLKSQKGE